MKLLLVLFICLAPLLQEQSSSWIHCRAFIIGRIYPVHGNKRAFVEFQGCGAPICQQPGEETFPRMAATWLVVKAKPEQERN